MPDTPKAEADGPRGACMKRIDAKVAEITGEKRDGKKEEDQGRRDTEKKSREDVIVVSADEAGAWHEAIMW